MIHLYSPFLVAINKKLYIVTCLELVKLVFILLKNEQCNVMWLPVKWYVM